MNKKNITCKRLNSSLPRIFVIFLSFWLNACSGSSMRIEVDVYKGPISMEEKIQWGELKGVVNEASESLTAYNDGLLDIAAAKGFLSSKYRLEIKPLSDKLKDAATKLQDADTNFKTIAKHLEDAVEKLNSIIPLLERDKDLSKLIRIKYSSEKEEKTIRDDINEIRRTLKSAGDQLQEVGNKLALIVKNLDEKEKEKLDNGIKELRKTFQNVEVKYPIERAGDNFTKAGDQLLLASYGLLEPDNNFQETAKKLAETDKALINAGTQLEGAGEKLVGKDKVLEKVGKGLEEAGKVLSGDLGSLSETNSPNLYTRVLAVPSSGLEWSCNTLTSKRSTECLIIAGMQDDATKLIDSLKKLQTTFNNSNDSNKKEEDRKKKNALKEASEIGIRLKGKAIFWAEAHVGATPSRIIRVEMANFANLASEYSNWISSKADALLKQTELSDKSRGVDRSKLPLSVYLRNVNPTDFLNMYTWNRAANIAIPEEIFPLHPLHSWTSDETADRVRVIERLFDDHNWSNINTVYTSGLGDVSTALVMDDIGNWNLKSFESDPSELLETYTKMTKKAVKIAIKAATNPDPTFGGAKALLGMASQFLTSDVGKTASEDSQLDLYLTKLHAQTKSKLETLKEKAENEENKLLKDLKERTDKLSSDGDSNKADTNEVEEITCKAAEASAESTKPESSKPESSKPESSKPEKKVENRICKIKTMNKKTREEKKKVEKKAEKVKAESKSEKIKQFINDEVVKALKGVVNETKTLDEALDNDLKKADDEARTSRKKEIEKLKEEINGLQNETDKGKKEEKEKELKELEAKPIEPETADIADKTYPKAKKAADKVKLAEKILTLVDEKKAGFDEHLKKTIQDVQGIISEYSDAIDTLTKATSTGY